MTRAHVALSALLLVAGCQCKRSAPAPEPLTLEYFIEHRASPAENERAIAELLEQRLSFTPDIESFETVSDDRGVLLRVRFMGTISEADARRVVPTAVESERQKLPRDVSGAVPRHRFAVEYVVSGGAHTLADLRSLHDSVIAPALGTVPGVQGISACGGRQSIQVELDPARVHAAGLTVADVAEKLPRDKVEPEALGRIALGDRGVTVADLAVVAVRPDDECLAWEDGVAVVVGKAHAERSALAKISSAVSAKLQSLQLPPGVSVRVRPSRALLLEGFSTPENVRLADMPSVIELSSPVPTASGELWRAVRSYDSLSNKGVPGIADITELAGGTRFVADVCGPDLGQLAEVSKQVIETLGRPSVSSWIEAGRWAPRIDPARAAEAGVSPEAVLATYELATSGRRTPIRITVAGAGKPELLGKLTVRGTNGAVPLSSLLELRAVEEPLQILRVNRQRCVRVTAHPEDEQVKQLRTLKLPAAVTLRTSYESSALK